MSIRILMTGDERDELPRELFDGRALEWITLPVLDYKPLKVDESLVRALQEKPFSWVIFSSPRNVQFFSSMLLEYGAELPVETQVACMGRRTSQEAEGVGLNTDFYPVVPGSEGFLDEFISLISHSLEKPTLLIPMAENGRQDIKERLEEHFSVSSFTLYRSIAKEHISLSEYALKNFEYFLFTSPSSVDAVLGQFKLPESLKVISLGSYTSRHLSRLRIEHRILPSSDFERLGEVLC